MIHKVTTLRVLFSVNAPPLRHSEIATIVPAKNKGTHLLGSIKINRVVKDSSKSSGSASSDLHPSRYPTQPRSIVIARNGNMKPIGPIDVFPKFASESVSETYIGNST